MLQKANKSFRFLFLFLIVLCVFAPCGWAEDNELIFSYRGGLNLSAKFSGVGNVLSGPFAESSSEDPQRGFEIAYVRRLGRVVGVDCGLEAAVNASDASISHTFTWSKPMTLLLGWPPFQYVRTDKLELEGTLYGLRVGPSFRFSLRKGLSCSVSGGFSAGWIENDVKSTNFESESYQGELWWQSSYKMSSGKATEVMLGWYATARINYAISDHFALNLGAQFQRLGTFSRHTFVEAVEVDLRDCVFVTAGVSCAF